MIPADQCFIRQELIEQLAQLQVQWHVYPVDWRVAKQALQVATYLDTHGPDRAVRVNCYQKGVAEFTVRLDVTLRGGQDLVLWFSQEGVKQTCKLLANGRNLRETHVWTGSPPAQLFQLIHQQITA